MLDTRASTTAQAGSTQCLQVAGINGVPDSAKAVAINLASVRALAKGFLVAYPQGSEQPPISTVNYDAGTADSTSAIVQVGTNGGICVSTSAETDILIDLVGYFGETTAYEPVVGFREWHPSGCQGRDAWTRRRQPEWQGLFVSLRCR